VDGHLRPTLLGRLEGVNLKIAAKMYINDNVNKHYSLKLLQNYLHKKHTVSKKDRGIPKIST